MVQRRKFWLIGAAWIAAIVLAAMFDRTVAQQVHDWGSDSFLQKQKWVRETLKFPGWYLCTVLIAIPVALLHRTRWRASVMLLLTTATSALNELIKWIAGRARPFKTITGNSTDLTPFNLHPFPSFDAKNLCFPSGHAALAFATAAALGILWPRWKWGFYVLGLIVGAERVLENAHWFSDVVAAAALGIGGVKLVSRWVWPDKMGELRHD